MIYITASNGVYAYDQSAKKVSVVMDNNYRRGLLNRLSGGFFGKRSSGYFGICYCEYTGEIIVCSREKLGTSKAGKPTTDCGIHAIDPETHQYRTIAYVKDVHDVHQIAVWNTLIFLTDTGKNRVVIYDIKRDKGSGRFSRVVNIGKLREDVNHVNAVTVLGSDIYIGLNNRGSADSEILVMPVDELSSGITEIWAEDISEVMTLSGIRHTHDVEPYNQTFLVSVSHDSRVIAADTLGTVYDGDGWVRGLCLKEGELWIGQSPVATRSARHKKANDGVLVRYDLATCSMTEKVRLMNTGQINDLIII